MILVILPDWIVLSILIGWSIYVVSFFIFIVFGFGIKTCDMCGKISWKRRKYPDGMCIITHDICPHCGWKHEEFF